MQYCLSISVILTQYTDQIQENFDKADITLSNITLLSTDDKSQLRDFSTTAENVDFSAIAEQVGAFLQTYHHYMYQCVVCDCKEFFFSRLSQMNNISRINLNTTADELDRTADLQVSCWPLKKPKHLFAVHVSSLHLGTQNM